MDLLSAKEDKLMQIGKKFSQKNKLDNNTWAMQKMARQLNRIRVPFDTEVPVIVKTKCESRAPKLYILDFYFASPINMAIEVDGGYHKKLSQREYDTMRDEAIEVAGIGKTLRFSNEEILHPAFDMVEEVLRNPVLKARISSYWSKVNDPSIKVGPQKTGGAQVQIKQKIKTRNKRKFKWVKNPKAAKR